MIIHTEPPLHSLDEEFKGSRMYEVSARSGTAPALVLDAHLKSSLAAIRSLGEKGVAICAGSHRGTAMGLYSRYTAKRLIYPSPLEDRDGFLDSVQRQAAEFGTCAVFAFSDSTLLPLVDNTTLPSQSLLYLFPESRAEFCIAFDKGRTGRLAESLGIEIPKTFWHANVDELEICAREISYPVILKPRRTVYWRGNVGVQKTASLAFSLEDLKAKFNRIVSKTGEPPLLQKYIAGEEAGVEFLAQKGRLIAACAHRRIRSASPLGGAGVVNQTVPLDYCGIGQRAERLIASLHWSGPAMIEFKICKKTGTPYLMEINGRFWGSLPLAVASGVDFPYLCYRLACGENLVETTEYAKGIVSRHFWGDVANLNAVLFRKDPMRGLVYPSRRQAAKEFFRCFRHSRPAVFKRNDVKPSFAELIDTVGQIASRVISQVGS